MAQFHITLMVDTQETKQKGNILALDRYLKSTKGRWTVDKYKILKLKTGDYVTEDWFVGFERKCMDLLGSVYSGVLKQQLIELRSAVQYPYLILEFNSIDEIAENFHTDVTDILGLLSSVQAKSHVPYILGGNYMFPHMIRLIHKHYEDLKGEQYVPLRPPTMLKQGATVRDWKLMRLGTLPNVGGKKAKDIYEHFGMSYRKAINAPPEEWMKIPGISEGICRKIQKVIK